MRHRGAHVAITIDNEGDEATTTAGEGGGDWGDNVDLQEVRPPPPPHPVPDNWTGRYVSMHEYLDKVYNAFLKSISSRPRMSDMLHGTFQSKLQTQDDYGRVTEEEIIVWMAVPHVLTEVLLFNYKCGNLPFRTSNAQGGGGEERVHEGNLRGIHMIGFPDVDVRRIAELVWETLKQYPDRYALYECDGALILNGGGDDEDDALTIESSDSDAGGGADAGGGGCEE